MENILKRLADTAGTFPEKTAFADETQALTFSRLFAEASGVAQALEGNAGEGGPVMICMEKTPFFAAAIFGVLGAGACYVPAEADTPLPRLSHMREACGARILLCDEKTREKAIAAAGEARVLVYEELPKEEKKSFRGIPGETPAYIMFTSGSSGAPKGVVVSHGNLEAYLTRLIAVMGFSEETVFANQTPLSTDASLKELFPTVYLGATCHFLPKSYFAYPPRLIGFLNDRRVNTVCWAASAFAIPAELNILESMKPAYLRTVSFGSEVLPVRHLRAWMEACPGARFTNLYGPTEATGVCCFYHVSRLPGTNDQVPVGEPFPDAVVFTEEETGEIVIGGPQVSQGYLGDEALTHSRFYTGEDGRRYYRTGDTGRFGDDGLLYYTGRLDFQLKRHGYRVEPAEIEACCMAVQGVMRCALVKDKKSERLVLYYEGEASEHEISLKLKDELPRYMRPDAIVSLKSLPLNRNGKADRMLLSQGV